MDNTELKQELLEHITEVLRDQIWKVIDAQDICKHKYYDESNDDCMDDVIELIMKTMEPFINIDEKLLAHFK